jgi:hypothetical protein
MPLTRIKASVIIDGTLGTADIADDAVTAAKIANAVNTDIATGVTANTTANAALPKAGGAMTGAITTNSTFDGVDIATRDAVLTSTTTTANAAASLSAAQTFTAGQRGEITALTDASSIATNLALSNNFSVTLGGSRTLANPTNIVAGQSGSFFITQDGTGSRTLAYGGYFKFVGGTAPTLSTAAASVDRIDYIAKSSTIIHAVASLDVK